VAAAHEEGGKAGGSKGRNDGEALLVEVDLAVPAAVGLGGGEHTTTTAHVTEGGGSAASNTGNTGDGATSVPRLSRVVHARETVDSVGLTGVLGHVGVDELNNVRADGGGEDGGERRGSHDDILRGGVHVNSRAGGHNVSILYLLER